MDITALTSALSAAGLPVEHDVAGRFFTASGRAGFVIRGGRIVVLDADGCPSTCDGTGRVDDVAALVREMRRLEGV